MNDLETTVEIKEKVILYIHFFLILDKYFFPSKAFQFTCSMPTVMEFCFVVLVEFSSKNPIHSK